MSINFHNIEINKSLKQLDANKEGLSNNEAEKRLKEKGPNILPTQKPVSNLVKFLHQFTDIMIIILLIASAVSITVALVEKNYSELIDGFIILAIVLINAIIGFLQELKAQKEMKALLNMTKPKINVKRDNQIIEINVENVVAGDIVILEAGDIVPADLRLIDSHSLKCDESSLTGESVAAEKNHDVILKDQTVLGDRVNMAYKGSVVTNGRGQGLVVAIGAETELGKIASLLNQTKKEITPLQKNIKSISKIITAVVLAIAGAMFFIEIFSKPNPDIMHAFLISVAVAVAAIPESLPAVITIIMSLGVSRLSKKKAIVKRLHAVETLGSTQIICSDKTGTLTQNVMTVKSVFYNNTNKEDKSNSHFDLLLKSMTLCNDGVKSGDKYIGDPTETALLAYANKFSINKQALEKQYERVNEIPFDSTRKLMTTVNQDGQELTAYVKGAPDVILGRCTKILIDGKVQELSKKHKEEIIAANKQMGLSALRVLGFAYKPHKEINKTPTEQDLVFIGLAGMIDPPRKEAFEAVRLCKKAHMRAIMITGDHKDTAFAIAKEIGICDDASQIITGIELDKLSQSEFLQVIGNIRVYARVSPENKVRIVKTLKSLNKIVAMTGDGVNDAPSLKMANIGVGMGITGTDVTKEVADIIITDDNFATIVVAVKEGRRIYANIKKTVAFLFSANLAEILSIFIATLIFPDLVFMIPVQILFVNLITDSFPAISLGLEKPEKNIMQVPPRRSKDTIFSNGTGIQIIVMGIVQSALIISSFFIGYQLTGDNLVATTMAFYTLNIVQILYLISIRINTNIFTTNPFTNKWIWISISCALSILTIIALTPIKSVLGLTAISLPLFGICLALSLFIVLANEITKFIIYKKQNQQLDK